MVKDFCVKPFFSKGYFALNLLARFVFEDEPTCLHPEFCRHSMLVHTVLIAAGFFPRDFSSFLFFKMKSLFFGMKISRFWLSLTACHHTLVFLWLCRFFGGLYFVMECHGLW